MIICSRTISAGIKKVTGIEHISVHKADGECHFFSDDEATSEFLPLHDFQAVCVYRMNHLSIDQWVREFQWHLKVNVKDERIEQLKKIQKGESNIMKNLDKKSEDDQAMPIPKLGKVILNKYEVNKYDDSDFYAVVLDHEAKTVKTIQYDSTRYASIGHDVLKDCSEKATAEDIKQAKLIIDVAHKAEMIEMKKTALIYNSINAGDTCEVIKGRKFTKGTAFLVTHFTEFRDNYGRVQCKYAHALIDGVDQRINEDNLKIIKQGVYFDNRKSTYTSLNRS